MRSSIFITIVLLFIACGAAKPSLPQRVTILSANYAHETLRQCSRSSPSGVSDGWTVSSELAAQIETDLPKLAHQIPGLNPNLFYRQYVGIVQSGKRSVYINAFAPGTLEKHDNSWQSKPVGACDGGDQFWGAVYDPMTRTFSELVSNGTI
ncbi:hypothetical protein [Undibacterium sp. Di24W]|uniref:hypothetical protein n=1 Tax=Undibacterium sp. Di24W TaxID=3413033 RepID=UPI003BEFB858